MTHLLGGVSPDKQPISDTPTNWNFDHIREIDQQEYQVILEARTYLHRFQREASLYRIFMDSYDELASFRELSEQRLRRRDTSVEMNKIIEGMDARLMALLSYFKTFLEYWMQKFSVINKVYYDSVTRYHLRNNTVYRICYHLRNYAQHFGSPLVNCVINSDPQTVDIYFSINKQNVLQAPLRGWNTKQVDLQGQPDQVRLAPYLEELRTCVKQMHIEFIRYDFATILSCYNRLNQLYIEAQAAFPGTHPWILSQDDRGVALHIVDIPTHHLETVRTSQAMISTP